MSIRNCCALARLALETTKPRRAATSSACVAWIELNGSETSPYRQ